MGARLRPWLGVRNVTLLLEKRNYPETLAARALLADGSLGELVQVASTGPHQLNRPTRPDWFLTRKGYGGILGGLAVHDIDLVLLLSGATEGTVAGLADRTDPEFALHGSLLLRAGSVAATIEVNWLTPAASPYHGDYRMRLTGTEGTAELFWAQNKLIAATTERPPWQVELPPGRATGGRRVRRAVDGPRARHQYGGGVRRDVGRAARPAECRRGRSRDAVD